MVRVIERIAGCYEVQDVEFGRVYTWRPESVVVECDCGKRATHKRSTLVGSVTTCECGADHTARIREELIVRLPEEEVHPWRSSGEETGIPF